VKLEKIDYENSRGPWFFDPNEKYGVRQPHDGKDKQLMKAVEVLKKKFDSKPLTEDIVNKIASFDEDLEKKKQEAKEKEEKEKKES